MEIETDINRIEELARLREKANWAFRCFLKSSDLSIGRIDSKVHELYREVSSRVDCTSCANCCRVSRPFLTKADVKRLSQSQGLSVNAFQDRYLQADEDGEGETFNSLPCPFLMDNRCTVYDHRPADCRSFPHLHKREFFFRVGQAFANCQVCPIVFNVYEGLKRELWHRRPGS
jgi:uncharacterized protein